MLKFPSVAVTVSHIVQNGNSPDLLSFKSQFCGVLINKRLGNVRKILIQGQRGIKFFVKLLVNTSQVPRDARDFQKDFAIFISPTE